MTECRLTTQLKNLASNRENDDAKNIAAAATAALNIIVDIQHESMTPFDLEYLAYLIAEIGQDKLGGLWSYLQSDALDCSICRALAQRR